MAPESGNTPEGPIIIDLEVEATAGTKPRDQAGRLQREAYNAVWKRLEDNLPTGASANRSSGDPARPPIVTIEDERRHDVITVNARRGDGKTTFVLSLLRDIEQGGVRGLYSLGIIDPTKVETKQNFTVLVVNRVWQAVQSYRKTNMPPDRRKDYENVQDALRGVAKGLNQLPGIGGDTFHGDQWQDPDYILDEGLDAAGAGDSFERHIDHFFKTAAEFLGVQAFVLAVDDIDTAFDRGWPVLEAIRKYLTSPYLKLILSGDLELYQLLVRRQQWAHMSKDFVDHERWAFKEFIYKDSPDNIIADIYGKVEELQDQYLIKIFQPENRIYIKNLLELSEYTYSKNYGKIKIKQSNSEDIPIYDFTRNYVRNLLSYVSRRDQDTVVCALLVQPLRTALRILAGGRRLGAESPITSGSKVAATHALRDSAYTVLSHIGLDPNFAASDDPRRVILSLIGWFTRLDDWQNTPRLYPEHLRQNMNLGSVFASAATTNVFRQRPDAMITYWIKIAAVRELINTNRVSGEVLQPFLHHTNLHNIEDSDRTAGRIAGWLRRSVGRRALNNDRSFYALPVLATKPENTQRLFIELYGVGYPNYKTKKENILSKYPDFAAEKLKKERGDILKFLPSSRVYYKSSLFLSSLPAPMRPFHKTITKLHETKIERPYISYTTKNNKQVLQRYILYNSIDSLSVATKKCAATDVLKLPYFININDAGGHFGTYSFPRLIGVIEKLISLFDTDNIDNWPKSDSKEGHKNPNNDFENQNKGEDTFLFLIRDALREATRTATYPSRESQSSSVTEDDKEGEEDLDDGAEEEIDVDIGEDVNETLVCALGYWLRAGYKCKDGLVEAPVTLARIWTRFHQAGDTISESLTHLESRYLGVAMHRYIVGFLHAVAVELGRQDSEFSMKARMTQTPTTTNQPFIDVINEMCCLSLEEKNGTRDGSSEESPESCRFQLFRFLFACPIWGFFLIQRTDSESNESDYRKKHGELFESYQNHLCNFVNKSLAEPIFGVGKSEDNDIQGYNILLDDLFKVNYNIYKKSSEFPNLYALLNTVPIQGQHIGPPPKDRNKSPLCQEYWDSIDSNSNSSQNNPAPDKP